MGKKDPRIDAYIAKSADFAKPILNHLRRLVHAGCPAVEETMKWSFPHFLHHGMLCSMAAFKQHCSFGFWKGALIFPDKARAKDSMGHFGRINKLADLPGKTELLGYIAEAARLNEAGVKPPPQARSAAKRELTVPDYFMAAVRTNRQALETFERFSYSHRKEYVEWVTGAKREETRTKRLQTAVAWMAEGKSQNWRYDKC